MQIFNGQVAVQRSRVADFHAVFKYGYLYIVGVTPVAMTKRIDDGFAQCLCGYFRHIHAQQTFYTHSYVYVFENVFLRFLYQRQNVSFEIMPVNDGGCMGGAKHGAA